MVQRAADYRWSSAAPRLAGKDQSGMLHMDWWRREAPRDWDGILNAEEPTAFSALRTCTYAGRPFGTLSPFPVPDLKREDLFGRPEEVVKEHLIGIYSLSAIVT